jgi:hypothetical protein
MIVHNEAMNRSLMPWIVASQTIPILALAPLIVVIGFNIFTGTLGIPTDPARLMSKAHHLGLSELLPGRWSAWSRACARPRPSSSI